MSRFTPIAIIVLLFTAFGCQSKAPHSNEVLEIRAADVVEHKKWTKTSRVVGGSPVWMAPKATIDQTMVKQARAARDSEGNAVVLVTLDNHGRALMERLCREQESRPVAVLLEGKVVSTPVLLTRFDGEFAVGSPEWTTEDARNFAKRLNQRS